MKKYFYIFQNNKGYIKMGITNNISKCFKDTQRALSTSVGDFLKELSIYIEIENANDVLTFLFNKHKDCFIKNKSEFIRIFNDNQYIRDINIDYICDFNYKEIFINDLINSDLCLSSEQIKQISSIQKKETVLTNEKTETVKNIDNTTEIINREFHSITETINTLHKDKFFINCAKLNSLKYCARPVPDYCKGVKISFKKGIDESLIKKLVFNCSFNEKDKHADVKLLLDCFSICTMGKDIILTIKYLNKYKYIKQNSLLYSLILPLYELKK